MRLLDPCLRRDDKAHVDRLINPLCPWANCAATGSLQPSLAICQPAQDWLTGISSSELMLRCGGCVATQ